jgi:hypothetical protein
LVALVNVLHVDALLFLRSKDNTLLEEKEGRGKKEEERRKRKEGRGKKEEERRKRKEEEEIRRGN